MKKLVILIVFVLTQVALIDAQTVVRSYQKISTTGMEKLNDVKHNFEVSPSLAFEVEPVDYHSSVILIEIEAKSKDCPKRIIESLLDDGFFNLTYAVGGNDLVFENDRPKNVIRLKEKEFSVELTYKVYFPQGNNNTTLAMSK